MVNNSININKRTSHLKITDYNTDHDIITLEFQVLARDGKKRSFVDISGMIDNHCLHFLFIISTISVI